MLSIEVDIDGNWAADEVQEQTAHAANALTRTARLAADDIRQDMPRRFILRNAWVQKGIRFDSARRDTLSARVYSVDPYMIKQDDGEVWSPDGHVAIPSAARPSDSSPIPRSMLPKALRGKTDVFKADFSRNARYKPFPLLGLFQRMGKGEFRVLYLLKDKKQTQPRWQFADQVETAVDRYFEKNFNTLV